MTGATESGGNTDPAWSQYGRALIQAMAEVREKLPEEFHGLILETADYWLSAGLASGTHQRDQALRWLDVIEAEGAGRTELAADAEAFCAEALV